MDNESLMGFWKEALKRIETLEEKLHITQIRLLELQIDTLTDKFDKIGYDNVPEKDKQYVVILMQELKFLKGE